MLPAGRRGLVAGRTRVVGGTETIWPDPMVVDAGG